MSAFPTGVSVITTWDRGGTPRGMTCSSLASVTLSPPTLLVCLHNDSSTLDSLLDLGRFAVNLLHSGGRRAAEVFSGPLPDRFGAVDWCSSPALGLPWLSADALAVAECRVSHTRRVGTHTVVFGEVAAITQEQRSPLLYGLRRFADWPAAEQSA